MSDNVLVTLLIILAVSIGITLLFLVRRNQRLHSIIHELESTLYMISTDKIRKGGK